MPDPVEIPVVLRIFNRSHCLGRVVSALRRAGARQLLVIADGPRPDHPADAAACRQARAVVEAIDWADLSWWIADTNLGPDRAAIQGLDWAFERVDEAIILEDDTVPAPDFFPWCAAMLDRYRVAPDISHICGRNELGRWSAPGFDHLLVHRGGHWGWASWGHSWRALRAAGGMLEDSVAGLHPDPLVEQHLASARALLTARGGLAWDTLMSLAMAVTGRLAVLPPVNLIANLGFGEDATRNRAAEDFRGLLPTGTVKIVPPRGRPDPDARYDRWALLVELLAAQRDRDGLQRLVKARHLVRDSRLRLHLVPFDDPAEAAAVLRHLRAVGVRSQLLEATLERMERHAADRSQTP
jgi:hypothetical protein